MPRSPNLFLFPDPNVWIALSLEVHIHHAAARQWLSLLSLDSRLAFCRVTQMSFLRLLTTEAVMGKDGVLTQAEAWRTYDQVLENESVSFLAEPDEMDDEFRSLSSHNHSAPKAWTDAYLAAFASASDLTLVSFDQGFRGKVPNLLLLAT